MRRTPPPEASPREGETVDQIIGDWWLYQLKKGHRFSTDDVLTAWRAAHWRPEARTLLDLGCGISSVGTFTLGLLGHDDATLVGIEAQDISVELARRSVVLNGLEDRVTILHGDLRDASLLPPDRTFELVTGSPPYIPLGKGIVSSHPQRAACRFELRGSVYDYCATARERMAPGAVFAYVMSARDPRTDDAPGENGLVILEKLDVTFRAGDTPMIRIVVAARAEDCGTVRTAHEHLLIREANGQMSAQYAAIRPLFGWPADG